MNPLVAVFKLSLRVLLKSKRTLIIGAFCCFPILASAIVSIFILLGEGEVGRSAFSILSQMMEVGYLYFFLVVVTLFYGTALVDDEIDEKTITYLFMRPVSRSWISDVRGQL